MALYTPPLNFVSKVVVNSPMTYTNFATWKAANNNLSWTNGLPRPYESIEITNGEPQDPEPGAPNLWAPPTRINPRSYMHHDAVFEMRTSIRGESGNQATYDDSGCLIMDTIAAGSADRFAPINRLGIARWNTLHRDFDVYPFIRALQLDGNASGIVGLQGWPDTLTRPALFQGEHTESYRTLRPTIN